MSFTAEGFFEVTITVVRATAARFSSATPPAFDLVFDVADKHGHTDSYALEVSAGIVPSGKHQGKPRWQVAYETLQALGFTGRLLVSEIAPVLTNTPAKVAVNAESKDSADGQSTNTYYNITWLGPVGAGSRLGAEMSNAEADALACQMFPDYAAAAPVQQQPPQAAPAQPQAAPVQTQQPSPFAPGGFA